MKQWILRVDILFWWTDLYPKNLTFPMMGVSAMHTAVAPCIKTLLNKPCENEVILRGQNIPLKFCQPLELLKYTEKVLRSFHAIDIGSVGQRATKLLSIKSWEWFGLRSPLYFWKKLLKIYYWIYNCLYLKYSYNTLFSYSWCLTRIWMFCILKAAISHCSNITNCTGLQL